MGARGGSARTPPRGRARAISVSGTNRPPNWRSVPHRPAASGSSRPGSRGAGRTGSRAIDAGGPGALHEQRDTRGSLRGRSPGPRRGSTPRGASTPMAGTARSAPPTFPASSPPARTTGSWRATAAARSAAARGPVPPLVGVRRCREGRSRFGCARKAAARADLRHDPAGSAVAASAPGRWSALMTGAGGREGRRALRPATGPHRGPGGRRAGQRPRGPGQRRRDELRAAGRRVERAG